MVSTSLYLEDPVPLFVERGLVSAVPEALPCLHLRVSSLLGPELQPLQQNCHHEYGVPLSSPSHSNELSNPAGGVRTPGLVSRWSRDPQTRDWHLKRQVLVGSRVLNPMAFDSTPGSHCIAVRPTAHVLFATLCVCFHGTASSPTKVCFPSLFLWTSIRRKTSEKRSRESMLT